MLVDLALQPKQAELYHMLEAYGPAVPTKLGFGGARGGAKSGAIRRLMLERRLKHPNTPGFIVRKNFPDIYENYIIKYQQEQPWMSEYYNAQNKEYRLPNGSRIAYKYADAPRDIEQISRGPEAVDIFIDQAEQFSEDELLMLMTPNRWPGSPQGFCKVLLGFNPGGPGTEYLRRVFHLKRYKEGERATDYRFIQAYGWDNYEWFRGQVDVDINTFYALSHEERFDLFISQTDYGRKLNSLPPSLRVGELLGSFDSFSGQYFAGVWDEQVCTITARQAEAIIQPWWTRWMAQDWGFGDHTAHGWFAAGKMQPSAWREHFGSHTEYPVDIVVLYREHVINQRAEADLAMDIVERTPEPERRAIRRFFLSQDAFGQRAKQIGANSVGLQYARIMERYGLPMPEPANQERINGWRFLYNCFRQSHMRNLPLPEGISQERSREGPALLISTECPVTIECVPLGVRDEKDIEDMMRVDGALWEDVCDLLRYGTYSMLGPKSQAPVAVRAQELYHSIVGKDPTPAAITNAAIQMKRFEQREAVRPVRRWRQ